MQILFNLYKLCQGNDEDFPKNFGPKNSTLFFLKYVKNGNIELNSKKILNILKQFIAETNILTLSEKSDLLEGIELGSDNEVEKDDEIYQNQDINIGSKNRANNEKKNLILGKEINNNKNILKEEEVENNSDVLDMPLKMNEDISSTRIQKNDFDKIEESIKLFSNRLNLTNITNKDKGDNFKQKIKEDDINDNGQNNGIIANENKIRKNKVVDNDEIKKNMNALNIPLSVLKNKLSLNNNKKLLLKINPIYKTNNNNINNINDKINNQKINSQKENLNISPRYNNSKPTNINNNNSKPYIQTLNQIMKSLKNEPTEEGIINLAIWQFLKLSSTEQKSEYIEILQKSLENPVFLKNTSINILLNFYDYILSILSFEILKFPKEETIIIKLQTLSQYLLNYRKCNDMFKIMLFLLKKYFPKDLNEKIADLSLVMIKIIAFLLKELLKNNKKEKINCRDIICEINDLFTNTPPSALTTATPNCSFYQNIFTLLKYITDEILKENKKDLKGIIQYLQEKKIVCDDYVQYLIKLNKTF